jgi:putative selenium metabolism hydrolase
LVAAEMAKLGFRDVHIDTAGNCVGYLGSGPGPRLLIDGHIDSIPLHSDERWTVDPYGGEIIDGRLYGLGICDQKASIAAAVHGLSGALGSGDRLGQVAVVASVNEEDIEGAALASVIDAFDPTWAVTTEPSDTRLCIGQRGRAKILVTVTGRACHAGHAAQGINAAQAAAALILAITQTDQPLHPQLGRRDITCIDILSSPYPSVSTVPGEAVARFDCRFLPGDTPDALIEVIERAAITAWRGWPEPPLLETEIVQAQFQSWTGASFSAPEFAPAWWTEASSPLVTQARRGLTSVGLDRTPTHYSFCTNGSYLAGIRGIPTVGFGVGEEHVAHQIDEYVTLASLRAGAAGLAAMARELLGPSAHRPF